MKQITIAGRIAKAPELRRTQSGDPVLSFSVPVDDGYGQNKSTMWFDVSIWGKRAAALEPHLSKGMFVTVAGDLGQREHNGKTYLTVRAGELTMQGGGDKPKDNAGSSSGRTSDFDSENGGSNPPPATSRSQGGRPATDFDDEIPFAPEWRA